MRAGPVACRKNSPSRNSPNRYFPRDWRGFCERATQSKVRTEPQEVALARIVGGMPGQQANPLPRHPNSVLLGVVRFMKGAQRGVVSSKTVL